MNKQNVLIWLQRGEAFGNKLLVPGSRFPVPGSRPAPQERMTVSG